MDIELDVINNNAHDEFDDEAKDGNIYINGPGCFSGYLTTNQSHLVKDVLINADLIRVLMNPEYEYYVLDSVDEYYLGRYPSAPNTVVFVGQTILIKSSKWFWCVRYISSKPVTSASTRLYTERPLKKATKLVSLGYDWVEILKSQTPHVKATFIVDKFWWKDPLPSVSKADGLIKLSNDKCTF